MAKNSLVLVESQKPVLLVNPKSSPLGLAKQEIVKVKLECPRCCWIFEAEKPDNQHPNCTFNKLETIKAKGSVIEEPRVCRNPKCKKQFAIYWYKTAATRQIIQS